MQEKWCLCPLLSLVVELDRSRAGFAGEFLRSSDERRHVIAANLLLDPPGEDASAQKGRAEFLNGARHQAILAATFDEVPRGLRGALARSGRSTHSKPFYSLLQRTLLQPPHEQTRKTIIGLDVLSLDRVRIARALPADLCTPELVKTIASTAHARDIIEITDLLTSRGIERDELVGAARRIRSARQHAEFWRRWSARAAFPHHPVPASIDYRPILDGRMLQEVARRYANCANRYLQAALEGRDAFAEFRCLEGSAVVHLRKQQDKWRIEGLFGRNNVRPRPQVCVAVLDYTAQFGVRERAFREEPRGPWDVLRRLTSRTIFEFDVCELDEQLDDALVPPDA
jgi:hypothetical protein